MLRFALALALTAAAAVPALGDQPPATVSPTNDLSRYDAAVKNADREWSRLAFSVRRAVLVTGKAPSYGAYEPRKSDVYGPQDTVFVYLEPVGFTWKPVADGAYRTNIHADAVVEDAKGTVLWGKRDFAAFGIKSREKVREFMMNLSLNLENLKAGDYHLVLTLHDGGKDRTATIVLPYQVRG